MMTVSVRSNVRQIQRSLSAFAQQQVPYALSQALTATAKDVQAGEKAEFSKELDRPTQFTLNAIRVQGARKSNQTATVFVMDKTAAYLVPYEVGGLNRLNSRALLKPVNQKTNQYGNIAKSALGRLKNRRDVFIGKVKTKDGVVNGVWQRTRATKHQPSHLKLMIKFADAHPTKPILKFGDHAKKIAQQRFPIRFNEAMAHALATARLK